MDESPIHGILKLAGPIFDIFLQRVTDADPPLISPAAARIHTTFPPSLWFPPAAVRAAGSLCHRLKRCRYGERERQEDFSLQPFQGGCSIDPAAPQASPNQSATVLADRVQFDLSLISTHTFGSFYWRAGVGSPLGLSSGGTGFQ